MRIIEKCSICGNDVKTKFELEFEDLMGAEEKIYRQKTGICPECGFVFTQNPFTDEQLRSRYKDFSKFEYDDDEYFLDYSYKEQCLRQKNFLYENIDPCQIGSVCEVGAASGYNLSLYKENNRNITGIEPSEKNCRLAKKNYGINMFNGMFSDYIGSDKKECFDLIFLSMVLEHIVDPAAFISQCAGICSKYMLIEVPTLDIRHCEEPMGIFCEEHVNLFTLDSLALMMRKSGFKLLNAEFIIGHNRYLPAGYPAVCTIWEKTDSPDVPFGFNILSAEELLDNYIKHSLKSLDIIRQKIDSIPSDMKLAVWGIGHHASMLLANTSLRSKNIVKVYDSDKRKHSLFFAGTRITGFDTADIENKTTEGILLTTYTAQKAIVKYIKSLNIKCPVFTLYDI